MSQPRPLPVSCDARDGLVIEKRVSNPIFAGPRPLCFCTWHRAWACSYASAISEEARDRESVRQRIHPALCNRIAQTMLKERPWVVPVRASLIPHKWDALGA